MAIWYTIWWCKSSQIYLNVFWNSVSFFFCQISKFFIWLDSHHVLIPLAGTEPINSLKIHSPAIFKLKTNWINIVLKIIRIFKTMLLVGKNSNDWQNGTKWYFTHILLAKQIFTCSIMVYVCVYLVGTSTYAQIFVLYGPKI